MKKLFSKIRNRTVRVLAILLCIIILFVVVVIAFISPIAKYLIEKYSEEYIGRQVTMSWLYVNPFTGFINAHNLVMNEKKSPQAFARSSNVSLRISVGKLLSKKYEISNLNLDHLWVNFIQDSTHFNFDDLITPDTLKKKKQVNYSISNLNITNSEFHYNQVTIPVRYFIKEVNFHCDIIASDVDTMHYKFDFESGMGSGKVKGSFNLNNKSQNFDLKAVVSNFDLKPMEQYVKDFASYGYMSAFLDADVHTIGNLADELQMMTSGKVAINDFHFGKTEKEDYASFEKFSLNIDSLSPANKQYFFSAVLLDSPYIKYEQYDYLDNFSRIFGVKGANIEKARVKNGQVNIIFLISDYIKQLALNLVNSQFRLEEFTVNDARLLYNDYSLLQKFSLEAHPINVSVRNIDTRNKRMYFTVKSKLHPFGDFIVNVDMNPNDLGEWNLKYDAVNLPLPLFNPFMVTSTSHPFNKGNMELHGSWQVANKQINGDNHILIINPTLADKVKNEGATNLPLGIALWFVRNINRTIDINIPVTGDLASPKYHFGDIILEALKNLFVKPPLFPYTTSKEKEKKKKEEYITMGWKTMQARLDDDQEDQLKKISRYMFLHPKSELTVISNNYEDREKEEILFFEAKKKFYLSTNNLKPGALSDEDSISICNMSIKDSFFVHYLNKTVNQDKLEFTVQGKCRKLIGQSKVNKEFNDLVAARKKSVMDFFGEKKNDRVKFIHGKSTIPVSGFSHYNFHYKGDDPNISDKEKKEEDKKEEKKKD
ncbi:MAG: DUF748 domain-containing protein [Chitinophagales bacterium]